MSDDELSDLWENATIVFDTNVLLDVFRYPSKTRNDFLHLLEELAERLWMPNQVGTEFHRERLEVPKRQKEALKGFSKAIEGAKANLKSFLSDFKPLMREESEEISDFINEELNALRESVKQKFHDYKVDVLSDDAHDQTFQKISELYDGRVGESYTSKKLLKIHSVGEQRYRLNIPPRLQRCWQR
ncbi:PIN-like domain-containing protein [Enteractinococcus helveticum]|uniref:PIN like domain-containing protein n=1 Tax=Enteractinococcus helveticum TaxID=1837282 RepID=A0A1B7M2G9_9MICC|nr:PIN-like domain-containing protein [Enteractinococcus helveticum]OAV62783.1 hypothetical protein A6F49_04565 [Enteractinococcus helveticum]